MNGSTREPRSYLCRKGAWPETGAPTQKQHPAVEGIGVGEGIGGAQGLLSGEAGLPGSDCEEGEPLWAREPRVVWAEHGCWGESGDGRQRAQGMMAACPMGRAGGAHPPLPVDPGFPSRGCMI